MNARERAEAIIKDILVNHLPRIKEGLESGYVDENQILIVYDHAVRARVLKEVADETIQEANASAERCLEHVDNLTKINRELEAEVAAQGETRGDIPPMRNVPVPGVPCGVLKQVDEIVKTQPVPASLMEEIQQGMAIVVARNELHDGQPSYICDIKSNGYPDYTQEKGRAKLFPLSEAKALATEWSRRYADMSFSAEKISELNWKPHKDQLQCACGGLVKEFPTAIEPLLKCERCERVYTDEQDVFHTRKHETIGGTKCPDATYWTTGTLLNGNTPLATEMQINLNGKKAIVRGVNGTFTLTYEQIVRMAINQARGHLNCFTGSDAELPMLSCVYRHRVGWEKLHGERSGSLIRGQKVECTPGMCIDAMDTSNA